MFTAKSSCHIIAEVLARQGVGRAVVSPGSRNAPLILALDEALGADSIEVVPDERSAAFIALGMAQASGKAVALACTSGTALLNYAPAVAEAYYQGVPLIVISADRPQQWIDQDDSQTLRQHGALQNFVKRSYDIPDCEMAADEQLWYANRIANEACLTAMSGRRGPVHINVQLHAPLTAGADPIEPQRTIDNVASPHILPPATIERLATEAAGRRILIVAGFAPPHSPETQVPAANAGNVWMMTETIANIATPRYFGIDSVIASLSDTEKELMRPDLVITLGGALVSRLIKQYLRDYPPRLGHWAVGLPADTLSDCFKCLARRVIAEPMRFLTDFCEAVQAMDINGSDGDGYAAEWRELSLRAATRQQAYLDSLPWCDFTAMQSLLQAVPEEYALQISNGTPIRYAQLLSRGRRPQFCNRGVSGIDGSTSTAVGYALRSASPTLLISGDMSLSYDLSGLAAARRLADGRRFRIALVNNSGGGIFRFVGTTASLPADKLDRYFCADPALDIGPLARALGLRYLHADSAESMQTALTEFFGPDPAPMLLEMRTDALTSAGALRRYFSYMAEI